jgi:putative DNA primase/helicase
MLTTNTERAREALQAIPPDLPRDDWHAVGRSAISAGLSVDDIVEWSRPAPNFKSEQDVRAAFRTIKPDGGTTPKTLFKRAIASGWSDKPEPRQLQQRPRQPTRKAQEPSKRAAEGMSAAGVWERCEPVSAEHPYIASKQGVPDGLRIVPAGDPLRIGGHSMAGALVIPVVRQDGSISSLQLVAAPETAARLKAEGKPGKLNLPGCTMEGWFAVGSWFDGGTCYVCEGIGQAWACWKATGAPSVVCFGAGRMRVVATALRELDAGARLVLVPDVGKERDALAIARAVRAQVAQMPDGWPRNADVNDLAQRDGFDALEAVLTSAKAPPQRYKLLSAADLAALPALAWRIRGVLPATGLAALYGPSASGKSFVALDMAAAIAEGAWWFGHRTEAAPVVYAALEGEAGFRVRVAAWEAHKGRKLPDNLHMVLQPFKLTEPQDVADLAAVVPPGAVVFIDTLNRAAPTSDENSSKDMGEILEAAKDLQRLTAGLVIPVHHTGKDATKGLRGHSSFFAAADAAIEVSRDGDRREWRMAKSKDGADGVAKAFRLQIETLGTDEYDEPITSCVVVPDKTAEEVQRVKLPTGGNQRLVLEALRPLFKAGEVGKPGAPPMRPCVDLEAAITKAAGCLTCETHRRTTRAREAVTGLVGRGVLGCHEGWLWLAA